MATQLRSRPALVSFSGLDGSGKSTQIENLRSILAANGFTAVRLAFWDDVVVGTRYREGFVHKVYKSEKGIGAPEKPVNRQDKNVRRWYLTLLRPLLYLIDAMHLRLVVSRVFRSGADVVIFDRYIYDELANLPLNNFLARLFVRAIRMIVPAPDIAYLLDTDVEAARARKPEYPIEFMHACRRAYFDLSNILGTIILIPPLPLEETKLAVISAFEDMLMVNGQPMRRSADAALSA